MDTYQENQNNVVNPRIVTTSQFGFILEFTTLVILGVINMREHDAHLMCRNGATPRYIFHVEHHDDFCVLQIFIEFCSHLRLQFQLQVFD